MSLAKIITDKLGGDWCGRFGKFAAPGLPACDRSVMIRDSGLQSDGVFILGPAGIEVAQIKDDLRCRGLLPSLSHASTQSAVNGQSDREFNSGQRVGSGGFGISAVELLKLDLPPIDFLVPGLISRPCLMIWGGKPKMGKSWAMLELATAVARGTKAFGGLACRKGRVLYAALEDNLPRIKERLEHILGELPAPEDLIIATDLPMLDADGVNALRHRCIELEFDLVIIDVLQRVRPQKRGGEGEYAYDSRCLEPLHRIAHELGIAIVVVHHMRKADGVDALDRISGSTGLTGVADAILTISADADGTVVWEGRGRDIEHIEWRMRFEDGKWSMVGETFSLTPDQRRVFEAVPIAPEMAGPKDIAKRCSVNEATVRQIVTRLTKRGVLDRPCPGQYSRFPSHCHLMEKSLETSS
jgi:hypothetical protein